MGERRSKFEYEELLACGRGELFGEGNAQLPLPPMLMFDRIQRISETGGANGRGEVRAEFDFFEERDRHPEDRVYTVLSGVFYIGFGDTFDGDAVTAYPPGTALVLPGDTWHFHWAKSGEYITQVTAVGPLGLEYANIHDDPRHVHANV